jgi:hypothetical protein
MSDKTGPTENKNEPLSTTNKHYCTEIGEAIATRLYGLHFGTIEVIVQNDKLQVIRVITTEKIG